MYFRESKEDAAFRAEIREFVASELPRDIKEKVAHGVYLIKEDYVTWQKILHKQGWFAVGWPKEYGGAEWDVKRQLMLYQECALADAPPIIPYGVKMIGPIIYTFGSDAHRKEHLNDILESNVWWAQGYSEAGAGSDLSALRTSAVLDGDEYVINGTKMWTTEAQWADKLHCLVRTSSDGRQQEGITYVVIDMDARGLSVTPIITIDDVHHTNQIFLEDVRIPVSNVIGEVGKGWSYARFLLGNERAFIAETGSKISLLNKIKDKASDVFNSGGRARDKDALIRELSRLETRLASLCAVEKGYVEKWIADGGSPGPESAVLKIRGTEILQDMAEFSLKLFGDRATAYELAAIKGLGQNETESACATRFGYQYLYGRCWSIFGGTNEIQREIIAKQLLGLVFK